MCKNIKRVVNFGDFHVLLVLCVSEGSKLIIFSPFIGRKSVKRVSFFQNRDDMLSALPPGAT